MNRFCRHNKKSDSTPLKETGLQEGLLRVYITALLESKLREADVSDGTRVPAGSDKHIDDLKSRISDLVRWRDKEKKGTENRANYSRLINKLKSQLRSAERIAEKRKQQEKDESAL